MNSVHLITVGTSLLTNCGWKTGQPLPRKADLLRRLDAGDPRHLSAELNAVIPFIRKNECSRVHLLATDTREGRLCRDALASWFQSKGVQLTDAQTTGLLPDSPMHATTQTDFNAGIRQFRRHLYEVVRRAQQRGDRVFLNATGGLKAEIAVAVLVAAELRIPAYYLHQSMAEPVFLPTAVVDPNLRKVLSSIRAPGGINASRLDDSTREHMQREGLIQVSRRPDGTASRIKLTEYGRYWAGQP